jgi:hypothetical protein
MPRTKPVPAATPTPTTKRCTACKRTTPIKLMKNHGGGRPASICKACSNAQRRPRYWADVERSRARGRTYARSARGRELNRQAVARWQAANALKVKAAARARLAIARGDIIKPEICEVRGCTSVPRDAHHQSYTRPLDVIFVCPSHHAAIHRHGPQRLKPGARHRFARAPRDEPATTAA